MIIADMILIFYWVRIPRGMQKLLIIAETVLILYWVRIPRDMQKL